MTRARAAGLVLALAGSAGAAWGFDFRGERPVIAVTADGQRTRIGAVAFTPQPSGLAHFRVRLDPRILQDHFLSMREFKCLPGRPEITCAVPYPYEQPSVAGPSSLDWLEHSLLFFFKQPRDYGAKLWNGVIFRFTVTADALVGEPQAIDLNRLGVPPERLDVPPYGPADRDAFAPGARWLTQLRIE